MPNPSKTILAYPPKTIAATDTSSKIIAVENYTSFIARLSVGTVSGTSPTLNAIIQQGIRPDISSDTALLDTQGTDANIIWDDYAAFAQITATNAVKYLRAVGGGNVSSAASDGALTAGTVQNGPLGSLWRIKLVVAGTNPSFGTAKVIIQFIP